MPEGSPCQLSGAHRKEMERQAEGSDPFSTSPSVHSQTLRERNIHLDLSGSQPDSMSRSPQYTHYKLSASCVLTFPRCF